jgi:hypothetical protein
VAITSLKAELVFTPKNRKRLRKYKPKQVTKQQMETLKTVVDVLMFDISDDGLERLARRGGPFCSVCGTSSLCTDTH